MQRNSFLQLIRQVQTRLRHLGRRQNADQRTLAQPPITLAEQVKTILLILGVGGFSLIAILFQTGWRFPQAFCVSPTVRISPTVRPPMRDITPTPNPAPIEFPPTPQTNTNQP